MAHDGMNKSVEDQSIDAVPSNWQRFKDLLQEYGHKISFVPVFMFFFYGGMAITGGSAYTSAFFGIVMTIVMLNHIVHRD